MNQGYPRLLGDIGGTNARWAWQESAGGRLQDVSVLPCQASASLGDSAANYLAATGHGQPAWAGIGIATPVTGDVVRMTNNAWAFSIADFKRSLGVARCLVINDFTALAYSLPALLPGDLRKLGGGEAVANAPLALLGPGTGLGVSGLLPAGQGRWLALSGEGGHVTLAAMDELESAVLAVLRARFGHVSAERVLSGPGLVALCGALAEVKGVAVPDLTPEQVTDLALAGGDALCAHTVRLFTSLLGNVAGNLALTLGARGGLYLGGGIVPRLGAAFDEALFRHRFEDKGRCRAYMGAMATWLITASAPALMGVSRALDVLPAP
jgi:glucokinase